MDFQHGEIITYQNYTGYVNFIDKEYITMCIKENTLPDEIARASRRNTNQVCICIHNTRWSDIQRRSWLLRYYTYRDFIDSFPQRFPQVY